MDRASDRGFELGKNKRVTIRRFKNINLIDIREYYLDQASGDMKPGKKGISLTEEQYDQLIRHRSEIENALIDLGSSRSVSDRPEMESLVEKKPKKPRAREEPKRGPQPEPELQVPGRPQQAAPAAASSAASSAASNPRLDDHLEKLARPQPDDDDDDDNTMEKDLVKALSHDPRSDEDISEAD